MQYGHDNPSAVDRTEIALVVIRRMPRGPSYCAHADKLKALAPNLTVEGLVERFSRTKEQIPRLREGLRLALNLPPS